MGGGWWVVVVYVVCVCVWCVCVVCVCGVWCLCVWKGEEGREGEGERKGGKRGEGREDGEGEGRGRGGEGEKGRGRKGWKVCVCVWREEGGEGGGEQASFGCVPARLKSFSSSHVRASSTEACSHAFLDSFTFQALSVPCSFWYVSGSHSSASVWT